MGSASLAHDEVAPLGDGRDKLRAWAGHVLNPKLLLLGHLCLRHGRLPGGRDFWPFHDVPRIKLLAAGLQPLRLGRARDRHSDNNHYLKRPILHLGSSRLGTDDAVFTAGRASQFELRAKIYKVAKSIAENRRD